VTRAEHSAVKDRRWPTHCVAALGCVVLLASASRAGPTGSKTHATHPPDTPAGVAPTPAAPAGGVHFPASGQTKSYKARKADGSESVAVPDDGAVQAGARLRFIDKGDGTVTDLNTGLMWEKKCDTCGGLHDSRSMYRWSGDGKSETIWDWLDKLNAEGGQGFARHRDWRIPNVKELLSIIDYARFNPAVGDAFNGTGCESGCKKLADPKCSCVAADLYWTSTTFSDFPAHALIVDFRAGQVDDRVKTNRHYVRAVRDGS
jgi:uncharacterized protein DUF1566